MSSSLGTALVTGASAGIGAVYADRLARRGHDLILVARDGARMEALAQRLRADTGRSVEVLPADLTDPRDVAHVAARLSEDAAVTLLVNNAGMALQGSLIESDAAEIGRLIALNVTAPTQLAAAAARAFSARGTGAIVNIASVLALAPELTDGAYSGSKAFVIALTQSLARELAGSGVQVQAVLPGITRTEIFERAGKDIARYPADWIMEAGDLVDAALTGLERGETITIPALADEGQWQAYEAARLAMQPNLSRSRVAPRYRELVAA